MATRSKIEWTDMTWNPTTGCTKISAGCENCYAERMANRLQAMGQERYKNGFQLTLQKDLVEQPFHWKKPRIIFVNSMSDLFHEDVPLEFIKRIFNTMNECEQHIFQILTKRSERLSEISEQLIWTDNIWMGVTIENENVIHRLTELKKVPAVVKFLSCEPLLSPIRNLELTHIDWVIVGGESGPKARPMKKSWVEHIFRQCREQNVPFFFKQWGGVRKDLTGRMLHDRTYDELPKAAYTHPFSEEIFNASAIK